MTNLPREQLMHIIFKLQQDNSVLYNANLHLKNVLENKEILIKSYSDMQIRNHKIMTSKTAELTEKAIEVAAVNNDFQKKSRELQLNEKKLSQVIDECNEAKTKLNLLKMELLGTQIELREKIETIEAADERVRILENQLDDENCCPICFAKYDESENARYCIKTCGHQACTQCLDHILRNSRACHICRKTFQLKNIMQLY